MAKEIMDYEMDDEQVNLLDDDGNVVDVLYLSDYINEWIQKLNEQNEPFDKDEEAE